MKPEWNIRFLIVGPGGIRTNFAGTENAGMKFTPRHPAYNTGSDPLGQMLGYLNTKAAMDTWSDPDLCAGLLVDILVAAGGKERKYKGKELPRKLLTGSDSTKYVKLELEAQLREIEEWRSESESVLPGGGADLAFLKSA